MKINITYIDGSQESFSNVDNVDTDDNFLNLNDEDENPTVRISFNQLRKVQYD